MNKNYKLAENILNIILKKNINSTLKNTVIESIIIPNINEFSNKICLKDVDLNLIDNILLKNKNFFKNLVKYRIYDEDFEDLNLFLNDLLINNNIKDKKDLHFFINNFFIKCEICNDKYPITLITKKDKDICLNCLYLKLKNKKTNKIREKFRSENDIKSFLEISKLLLPEFDNYKLRKIYRNLYFNL